MPDELQIIEEIRKAAGRLPAGYRGVGDDVAVVPLKRGKLALKADMLVWKTDVPKGMSHRRAARKAVAMCVSDFAAKGVRPDSYLASMALPRSISLAEVRELRLGFSDASREWRLNLVGGDTNEGDDLVIDCLMVGFGKGIVPRGGAKPGDVLVTTGAFGYPPAGLKLLAGGAEAGGDFRRRAVSSVVKPTPDLEVGLALAPFLKASMDSSDGLSVSLYTLAAASRVGFVVEDVPTSEEVVGFARRNRLSVEELVFGGGEEYLVVGTMRPEAFEGASRSVRKAGGRLLRIGRATDERGKVLMREGESFRPLPRIGWKHLG